MKTSDSMVNLLDGEVDKHFLDGHIVYQCNDDESSYVILETNMIKSVSEHLPPEILRNFRFKNDLNNMFVFT